MSNNSCQSCLILPMDHGKKKNHYTAILTNRPKGEIKFYCEGEPDQHLREVDIFMVPSGKKHTIKLDNPTRRKITHQL